MQVIWTSCTETQESKPDSTKLSKLSDQEILHIFKDAGVNPDNINIKNFRHYIVDEQSKGKPSHDLHFITIGDLREFLKEKQEQTNATNQRTERLLDSLDKKKFKQRSISLH